MKPKNIIPYFIFLILTIPYTQAQQPTISDNVLQVKTKPLAFVEQHILNSKILEQKIALDVYLPETYNDASIQHTYPIILLLENEFFYQITGAVKHLSSVDSMPEAIVVGFPSGFEKFYAPKVYTNNSDFWPKSWKQMPFDGAPETFVDFLRKELFMYLQGHYRTADYRMIIGTSPTSTFPLHAFCKEPGLFQAHIAIAAGDILGMGYEPEENFINAITESIKTHPDRRAHLYITSADADTDYDATIGTNIEELERQMTPFKSQNLKLKAEIFPNESHYGVVLPAFTAAMETFFPKKKWNLDFRDFEKQPGNTLNNIDVYFQKLSSEYGYTILPKADRWNSGSSLRASANRLLRQKRFEESIQVYQRLTAYRPKSPEALSRLASAFEANNNLEKALMAQEKALELAKKHDRDHLTQYEERMEKISSKINDLKE